MFYEVTVLNTKNKKKKIISTKELSRRHWAAFEESHKGYALSLIHIYEPKRPY